MFKKILVPIDVDHHEVAAAVYQRAAELARLCGAEIHLIGIMPGFGMPIVASFITEEMSRKVNEKFKQALEMFIREHCREPVTYTIRTGKHSEEIIKTAKEWGADLIVVYHNHRREMNEAFSGSCSQRVSEHAPCSVLRLRRILT